MIKLLESALKRLIPISCLPMNYPTHADLANELVAELEGSIVMMGKREYEGHLRRMEQVRRVERAIAKGCK